MECLTWLYNITWELSDVECPSIRNWCQYNENLISVFPSPINRWHYWLRCNNNNLLQHRDNITMVIKFNNNGYNVIVLFSVQNTVKPHPATTSHKWLPIENSVELRYTNDFLYRSISMEKNLDILTKPCYSRQVLPVP